MLLDTLSVYLSSFLSLFSFSVCISSLCLSVSFLHQLGVYIGNKRVHKEAKAIHHTNTNN
jgi:hypothetical protein